jgi:hypothetical protein
VRLAFLSSSLTTARIRSAEDVKASLILYLSKASLVVLLPLAVVAANPCVSINRLKTLVNLLHFQDFPSIFTSGAPINQCETTACST